MKRVIASTALLIIGLAMFAIFGGAFVQNDWAVQYLPAAFVGLGMMVAGVVIEEVL